MEFLGTAEFASRWKKELTPGTVSTGKTLSRIISNDVKTGKGKNIQNEAVLLIKKYSSDEREGLKKQWNNSKNKSNFKELKEYKTKIPDPWETPIKPENKIKSLADRKKELLDNINKGLEESKEKIANRPPRPRPDVKYKPLPKPEGKVKQLGKALLKNKGKLALLAGAGTLGAVGYGLIRKARSDKGKKRRFYNR